MGGHVGLVKSEGRFRFVTLADQMLSVCQRTLMMSKETRKLLLL